MTPPPATAPAKPASGTAAKPAAPAKRATTPTVSQLVVEFAATRVGQKVKRGECWDVANEALRYAKATTPDDGDLYDWGDPVAGLAEARPGDVLQFEGVVWQRTWRNDKKTGWEEREFEHHTAIVERVDAGLFFTLLHANVADANGVLNKKVHRLRINLSPELIKSGSITVFRPAPRAAAP
jgi:hypothetical protein